MGQYFKAAFLARLPVPGLGRLPLNVLGVAVFGILGFVAPVFWLIGLGLEVIFLVGLATNKGFQNMVHGEQLQVSAQLAEVKRGSLIRTLPLELQQRLIDLRRRSQKVIEVSEHADEFVAQTNRVTLERLEWVYLKLLIARNNLTAAGTKDSVTSLTTQIAAFGESPGPSQLATQAILKERLANIQRRKETLDEIDSDLTRIEAQVELMLGNAALQGKPVTVATDIELACNLAASSLYGESGGVVADLEQSFGGAPGLRARESA
jgi:hypothetical protein